MFLIKCEKCLKEIKLDGKENPEKKGISLRGQVEALVDSDVYILCECSNRITIDNYSR